MSKTPRPTRAIIDRQRRSASIPRRLMPVLLALHAGETPGIRGSLAELRADGLLERMQLDPLLATFLEIMTNPTLVVTVETTTGSGRHLATIFGTLGRAVIGTTNDSHSFDLIEIDPHLLPFHLAQTTRLVPGPQPPFSGGFALGTDVLDLSDRLSCADPTTAESTLTEAGIAPPWRDRLLIALSHRRSLWTVESIWLGNGGRGQARLAVLDAGPAGCWKLTENEQDHRVWMEVADFDAIMQDLARLLPGRSSPGHIVAPPT